MNKLKPWLLLALMFVAGFAGGVVVTRAAVRNFVRNAAANPDLLRVRIEREMAWTLKLDRQQRLQVAQILKQSHERLRTLRQQFQPQIALIVQDARKDISAVLTPAQQERFEQFMNENRPFLPLRE